jgi:murein tripeptide amidase MpaA
MSLAPALPFVLLSAALAAPAPQGTTALTRPPVSLAAPAPAESLPRPTAPYYWRTRAERTDYKLTADYDETLRYCRQLEAGSNWVKLVMYGKSGQGRDLPLLIVSKDRAFTPEAAIASGKPIVLIQNGIHSGEIEGKDACLALVRDLAVLKTHQAFLDQAIVLVIPIFSVDAHERSSRYNRINQNGPEQMGWRATPIGLNLNRDFTKAESPEMRALLTQVFTRWWPHVFVDNHTTDGADYQHDLTYNVNQGPATPAPIRRWMVDAIAGRAHQRLEAMGHLPAPYISFRNWRDPRSGIEGGEAPPRFSNGYPVLHGRAAILTETHMLKPYGSRVRATYDFMVAILEEIAARPRELLDAVAASEAEIIARGREADPARRTVVLTSTTTDSADTFAYKGLAFRWEPSDILGAPVIRYTSTPWDTLLPYWRKLRPRLTVQQPVGYLVPQEWTAVRQWLEVHGVRYQRLARAWRDTVEMARVEQWQASNDLVEGHHPIGIQSVRMERRLRGFRAGDLWVPLDQRGGLVAVHLLEAQAPDGLVRWNVFDTVLMFKEYGEEYVVEPMAREMMAKDPALAKEFRARVAADTAFAKNPFGRSDFFYRRSPYADPEQNLIPVARALRRPPAEVLGAAPGATP